MLCLIKVISNILQNVDTKLLRILSSCSLKPWK